ncbi:MAG: DUF5060 domain-containing protein, partial [Pirellulaceae bacterium]|nr:DUF5060 domain-containing protein [Pirellulaceae bacterium]
MKPIALCLLASVAMPVCVCARDYYVSTSGNDENPGTTDCVIQNNILFRNAETLRSGACQGIDFVSPGGGHVIRNNIFFAAQRSSINAQWFNATNGVYTPIAGSPLASSPSRDFTTPGDNGTGTNDWVLVLETTAAANGQADRAANFTSGTGSAARFGVHEIVLTGNGSAANPFDTVAAVKFVPPSGEKNAKTVHAFFDGDNTWRARVYASEVGEWTWSSKCDADAGLAGKSGTFRCQESALRGRLLPHPKNSRQWMTEDGRWFLNLSDTAYFLLCAHDGNGDPVSNKQARQYVSDDVRRGITSLRCFLASRRGGFAETQEQWVAWHFETDSFDRFRLETAQHADRRLQMLLDEFPDVAVQLILFPLEGYGRDDRFWTALSAAQRERLLRNLVARFAAYPQLFWLMTNDAHYGPKYPNSNAMVREVGAYLQQRDPWQHPRSTGHARRLPFVFGGEDWVDYIHIEHEHDLGALEYARYHEFAKPVFLGEDRYEQDHGPSRDPTQMRYWQRRLFWAWLLSGGSANYGGRWWAVQPYAETGTRTATYYQRPDVTFRQPLTGLDSVRPLRGFFEQRAIDLGEFAPDPNLAQDAERRTGLQAPRLMRRGQSEFLVYHPHAAADG